MDEKIYELTIPTWSAVIPADWPLEIRDAEGAFVPAAGTTIHIKAGTQLRSPHDELLQGMLNQGFIQEVADGNGQ